MLIELKIPEVGESITEVEIGEWLKKAGERVGKEDPLVTVESEKATVELPSPAAGTLKDVLKQKGDVAKPGDVIAHIETDGEEARKPAATKAEPRSKTIHEKSAPTPEMRKENPAEPPRAKATRPVNEPQSESAAVVPTPKESPDFVKADRGEETAVDKTSSEPTTAPWKTEPAPKATASDREEEIVPMTRLRRTIAQRLVEAQHTAALLTTFSEIDMSAVMSLRKEHGEAFQKKYNVKLGFMSFFVKACVDALKEFPTLNAKVRENSIVYHNYFDIGIAIGGGKGLVVPVLRNAERMSFAEIELAIADLANRARENKLKVGELEGGTFTITNGGIYGSMLSTPIINPPQSGILGMHAIQERAVVRDGNVVARPMMFVALTYDHRIVDGREAVSFLKRVKDVVENPARMLIEV